MDIRACLEEAVRKKASDFHIVVGISPTLRISGELVMMSGPKVTSQESEAAILGILNEELTDIQDEKSSTIEGLKHTPAAALGTCRYKIDFKRRPEQAAREKNTDK